MSEGTQGFDAMRARLDEIVEEVSAEGISLDEALALYEEAVKLGLAACDVSEADILVVDEEDAEPPASEAPAGSGEAPASEDAPAPEGPTASDETPAVGEGAVAIDEEADATS